MTDEELAAVLRWQGSALQEGAFFAAADRIEALNQEVKDLKKLIFAAYCEGFNDGKDGGWIVGPSNQPWKASDTHKALSRMEARNDC